MADQYPNDITPPIHFENDQWVVTDIGIESKGPAYVIEGHRLDEMDWSRQVGEKTWVHAHMFNDALAAARKIFP